MPTMPHGRITVVQPTSRRTVLLVLAVSALFSALTVLVHVRTLGIEYLETGSQIHRHLVLLAGEAGNPCQYRVLSTYLAEGAIRAFCGLGVPHPIVYAFIPLRILIGLSVFIIAYRYWRALNLPIAHVLIGMSLFAWGMTHVNYDSDLQFSTYLDMMFYLLAGLCIVRRAYRWIIPIAFLAALNRETSLLIPLLPFGIYVACRSGSSRSAY